MTAETDEVQQAISELLRAVRAEIDATIGAETGFDKVALTDGRVTGGDGEQFEYSFTTRGWKESFAEKPLLVRPRPGAVWESAELVAVAQARLRLRTPTSLGMKAELREDDTAGLVVLAEQLEQAAAGSTGLNLTTAGWLLGRNIPAAARCPEPERYVRDWRSLQLNDRQRAAVVGALGSELAFVWGPPGTGKTEVVGHIVEGSYRQGHRVLFLAPTKVAVDQAMERLCTLLNAESGFADGLVQRLGDIAVSSLKDNYGKQIEPDKIVARLSAALSDEISVLRPRLAVADEQLALHVEYAELTQNFEQLRASAAQCAQGAAAAAARADSAVRRANLLRNELTEIGVPSGMFASRRARRRDELLYQLQAADRDAADSWVQHQFATAEQQRLTAQAEAVSLKCSGLRSQLTGIAPVERLAATAASLRERLAVLQEELRTVEDVVRRNCRVMGTTVAKAVQSRSLINNFDTVVIDEAGMVNLPSAWYAAALAAKRVVVAGDFRQLPAVTRASSDRKAAQEVKAHSERWMDRDAFHAAGMVDDRGRVRPRDCLVGLNTQYRMRPAICAVVNTIAYPDAPLVTGRGDTSRLPPSPLLEAPLILVDTASRRTAARGGSVGHKVNPVHEAVIHELVRGLQYDGVLPVRKQDDHPPEVHPSRRMAVITPYRDQVRALQGSLAYRFGVDYDGVVDTVHRFQGSQRPLVVIDTVAGAGDRVGFFYEGVGLSSATSRLLNVAVSRAQDHLVVVADVDFLSRNLKPHGEAARLVDYLQKYAHRLDVGDLVPFRAADDLANLGPDELSRPAFFPSDEVPRAVAWDIDHARRSIDVYCAFLDPAPVERWLSRLKPRIDDGLRVTIHTRPSQQTKSERLIAVLDAAGCIVVQRERMHEKVVIIDDEVLWHGSLNLLAGTGLTDLMMRITDPGACERVRRIVERARPDRPARPSRPGRQRTPQQRDNGAARLYLNVPYEEKEAAKASAKARWDPTTKRWYVAADTPHHLVERWL